VAEPDPDAIPHPRVRDRLIGQARAERALAAGERAGRLHHAWLIGGPEGVGKATLAYRFARFLVAPPTERLGSPDDPLAIDLGGRTARQVAAGSHPNLMVLERSASGDKAAPKTIPVEAVRKALTFFGSTAADGGHRVCIVDAIEDLNAQGANALLKTIEEPPARATILIVSHAPQRVLATVRSRCRKLDLDPLAPADIRTIIASLGADFASLDPGILERAAALAEGSVGRALSLLDPRRLALLDEMAALLGALPGLEMPRVLAMADRLADKGGADFALALDAVNGWVSGRIAAEAHRGAGRLAPLAEVCEKIDDAARALDAYNLDRRSFVVTMFGSLAEAVRRAAHR
jgi:DNA polymerase-3 subunit delta'